MKHTLMALGLVLVLVMVACARSEGEKGIPGERGVQGDTPAPTGTPYPTLAVLPTHRPYPVAPTLTPQSTYAPHPTGTPYPTQAALPTHTPYAAAPTLTPPAHLYPCADPDSIAHGNAIPNPPAHTDVYPRTPVTPTPQHAAHAMACQGLSRCRQADRNAPLGPGRHLRPGGLGH